MQLKSNDRVSETDDLIWTSSLLLGLMQVIQMITDELTLIKFTTC